ncbi:MAG: acyloxyacyl hydrolase [Flavobacteriaceae bacterium]|nr:acyloxyacyl hydrolase [Flavobacteriaceae bacterium]
MKKSIAFLFFFVLCSNSYSQATIQLDGFYGQLIEHDKKLAKAIDGNASGIFISWSTPTTKNPDFNTHYNAPEKGWSLLYENLNSEVLGHAYTLFRHYSFFLNNKNNPNSIKLSTGFGLAYLSHPYHEESNPFNQAIGSSLLFTGFLKLDFKRAQIIGNWGLQAGLGLYHYSNAAINNPNLGLNTIAAHAGINYQLTTETIPTAILSRKKNSFEKLPIYYNVVIRGGINESKIIDSGRYSFYTLTAYGSKKINWYSTLTFGTEVFYANFLPRYAQFINSTENKNLPTNNKLRVGILIGHELQLDSFSFITQVGYYAYNPVNYISNIYERIGFKHQLNTHIFTEVTIRVNLFRAENLEFGLGYRF